MTVSEFYRGKRIGKRMLSAAERWVFKRGFDCCVVNSSNDVVEFYEKCGYRVKFEQRRSQPIVFMTKELCEQSLKSDEFATATNFLMKNILM